MIAWLKTMVYDQDRITDQLVDERMHNALADGAIERMKTIFGSIFDPRRQATYTPLWTRAAGVATPTLMLWGRDDRMLPYDQAHLANRQLPDIELHTFARCGHWIQTERKTDFERVVLEFFTRETPCDEAG
jgi:4,5:9,10-diseco-3-hydroxy-5,9,17-trioxoandrosta-1(10),2-diene-4-oate hydrolase